MTKRLRATRAWLIALSVVAVVIGAGCGGAGAAAARAIGSGAGRAAGTVGRGAVHVAPAAYRPAVQAAPVMVPRPAVSGAGFRVGERVESGAAAGSRSPTGWNGHVDVPSFGSGSGSDDNRKK